MKHPISKLLANYRSNFLTPIKPDVRKQFKSFQIEPKLVRDYASLQDSISVYKREINNLCFEKPYVFSNDIGKSDIYLPFVSLETLRQIPNYLLLFDKVYIVDPIYNNMLFSEQDEEKVDNTNGSDFQLDEILSPLLQASNLSMEQVKQMVAEQSKAMEQVPEAKQFIGSFFSKIINDTRETLDYYRLYKEFIEEGVLIPVPVIDLMDTDSLNPSEFIEQIKTFFGSLKQIKFDENDELEKYNEIYVNAGRDVLSKKTTWEQAFKKIYGSIPPEIIPRYVDEFNLYPSFMTSLFFKQFFPPSKSPHMDLGGDKNQTLIDKMIALFGQILKNDTQFLNRVNWSSPSDELIFATIGNATPESLLTIRTKETAEVENFRYKMQKRLMTALDAIGTKDYSQIVDSFKLETESQIAEMGLFAKNLKRKYRRQSTFQMTVSILSASATILAATATTQDPLALIGVGVGSAGFSTGMVKCIESWLEYKNDIDKLKEKDAYILWKVRNSNQ